MTSETFVVMLYHIEPSSRIAIIDKTFKPNSPTISMNLLYDSTGNRMLRR
jgi:hypothetical protein